MRRFIQYKNEIVKHYHVVSFTANINQLNNLILFLSSSFLVQVQTGIGRQRVFLLRLRTQNRYRTFSEFRRLPHSHTRLNLKHLQYISSLFVPSSHQPKKLNANHILYKRQSFDSPFGRGQGYHRFTYTHSTAQTK